MLRHGERDADVARAVQVAGLAVVEQAEVLDAGPDVLGAGPRPGGDDAHAVAEVALELLERERRELPAVPPVAGPRVHEDGHRVVGVAFDVRPIGVEHAAIDRGHERRAASAVPFS